MKKLLFLLLLLPCVVKAQTVYTTVGFASEIWNNPADEQNVLVLLQNDLKPQYTGGLLYICDTCAAPDSITRFGRVFNSKIWKKMSEVPIMTTPAGKTGQVIKSDGSALGYANVGSLFSALALQIASGQIQATLTPTTGSAIVSNAVTLPSAPARTPTQVTRPVNSTSWQVSTTQGADVCYSVLVSISSTLLNASSGTVYLETSPNNSTWTTISQSGISTSGVLATTTNTQTVSGYIPVGYYVRMRYAGIGGTNSATYQSGQETTYN